MSWDYDFLIIGSGFGGSVSAMRLTEKGYSVAVVEQGKRYTASQYPKTNWNLRRYLWFPLLRCFGIQRLSLFKNILILSGSGVGGGSLVYANTLLHPPDAFFQSPAWSHLADWKKELEPHYATARRMLGVTQNPHLTFVDDLLRDAAVAFGKSETFQPTDVGVFFGTPEQEVADPYFEGKGPRRSGCNFCGGCMVGCRFNAKNTLDKNYLYFAEKNGAKIFPETEVVNIRHIEEEGGGSQGYEVLTRSSTSLFWREKKTLRAKKVIISAGVLGTIRLLLQCRDIHRSLPKLSPMLGRRVRTNSEALIGVTEPQADLRQRNYSDGIAISSVFHPDEHTSVEPVRYSRGSSFMRLLAGPLVDGGHPWVKFWVACWSVISHPRQTLQMALNFHWAENSIILLIMQTLDSHMRFKLGRGILTGFRSGLVTEDEAGAATIPSYIPIGHQVARWIAKQVKGVPQGAINEAFLGIPTTAHILGGCPIGQDPSTGVIDADQQVFGYPGLYVCDGSAIPANLGVNPSLTITAMTERAMFKIPLANDSKTNKQ